MRIKYQDELELQHQYDEDPLCGYIRDPDMAKQKDGTVFITGRCGITNNPCVRRLPMEGTKCRVYHNLLKFLTKKKWLKLQ